MLTNYDQTIHGTGLKDFPAYDFSKHTDAQLRSKTDYYVTEWNLTPN